MVCYNIQINNSLNLNLVADQKKMVKLKDAILNTQTSTRSTPHRPRSNSAARRENSKAGLLVAGDKLSLNYQDITSLQFDRPQSEAQHQALLQQLSKVKKLFLSHNSLNSLEGIELFSNLTHLSISHNRLCDIEELSRVNQSKLQCLAVKGNYFIDRHPDYKALIVKHFSNLKELDSLQLFTASSSGPSVRGQLRDSNRLKHVLIPFLIKLDRNLQLLASQLGEGSKQLVKMELVQAWNRVFAKDFSSTSHAVGAKRSNSASAKGRGTQARAVTATQMVNFIRMFDDTLASSPQLPQTQAKASRRDLHDLFQWLYQEVILKMSTELNNADLVKFLNYMILQKYPQLATYLIVKNQLEPQKPFSELDHRQVDKLCTLLDCDSQINLEVLLAEQLNMFYSLQPEEAGIPDPSAAIAIVDETERAQGLTKQEMFDSICEAVEKARSESKSPDKQSLRASSRLLVPKPESVADPIVLANQKHESRNTARAEEFSFREAQTAGLAPFAQQDEGDRNVNEQSFLIMERPRETESVPKPLAQEAQPQPDGQAAKARGVSPTMASLFKVKQCSEAEILPSKDITPVYQEPPPPRTHGLKMQVPRNHLQGGGLLGSRLGNQLRGSQERFIGEIDGHLDKSDSSFPLSSTNSLRVAQERHQAQPGQQVYSAETRDVLAKFIQGDNDEQALKEAQQSLEDRVLSQFPIFALNEDYMKSIAMIIQDKIERAKVMVKQISNQVYQQQPPAVDQSMTSSAGQAEALTDAQKEKLSLLKRKLQESRESQGARGPRRAESAGRARTRSAHHMSSDARSNSTSAYSPVSRPHAHQAPAKHTSSDPAQPRRVFASELLREQAQGHKRQTDEESAQLWVLKQQRRAAFAAKFSRIAGKLEYLGQAQKIEAFAQMREVTERLGLLEAEIGTRHDAGHRARAFYFWYGAFKQKVELTQGLHALKVKQRVFSQLNIVRQTARLNEVKVDRYHRQKLQLKSFFSMLKFLEQRREERHQHDRKQQSPSPNKFKRHDQVQDENGGLGLVNVVPVMDKQIEGVYDGPLLSAVETLEHAVHYERVENPRRAETDHMPDRPTEPTISFQDKSFSYTNALINARKKEVPSAYHKKQVNFFKKGGLSGLSRGARTDASNKSPGSTKSPGSRSNSKRAKSRKSLQTNNSKSILKKGDQSTKSVAHNVTVASNKWSVVNQGPSQQAQNLDIFVPGFHDQTAVSGAFSMSHQSSFGAHMQHQQQSLTNELPPQASRSSIDMSGTSGPSQSQSHQRLWKAEESEMGSYRKGKQKRSSNSRSKSRSRSKSGKKRVSVHDVRNQTERLHRQSSAQENLVSFRPQNMVTTLAKGQKRHKRSGSRSAHDAESSRKCIQVFGQLSKSIKDPKPKHYEKNTVSFVSKFTGEQKSECDSVSQAFRKMRSLGGHSEFLKQPSLSTKKAHQKLLVK